MLNFGNKEFRNLQEQVYKNMRDIGDIKTGAMVLDEFGIKVVGQEATIADMPTVDAYKANNPDWEYGDAFAIGTEEPYDLYILTRANDTHADDYWFNIGEFPAPGPQGPQGEQGPQGVQGQTGATGQDGTPAGFGLVTATATTLAAGEDATVSVTTSGSNTEKNFAFTFGIPKGEDGETPTVEWGDISGTLTDQTDLVNALSNKQNTLVSGTNIKTINNESILGSGNIDIQSGGDVTDVEVNGTSVVNAQGVAEVTVPVDVSDLNNDAGYITSSDLSGYATETWVGQQGYAEAADLATVATTGSYTDLIDKPTIPTATSDLTNDSGYITGVAWGSITGTLSNQTDLNNALGGKQDTISDLSTIRSGAEAGATAVQPADISDMATETWVGQQGYLTSVSWSEVSDKPTFATVATSGDYDDLTNKPTIPTVDYPVTDVTVGGTSVVSNKVAVIPALFDGDYDSLTNKPDLSIYAESSDLATVATTGDYDDLTNKPTIPAAQVNSDWNAASGVAQILNKPTNLVTTNTVQTITSQKTFDAGEDAATVPLVVKFDNNDTFFLKAYDYDSTYAAKFDFGTGLTTDRTYSLPDKTGTVALTSDIPSNYVTTDTDQLTLAGDKTWLHEYTPSGHTPVNYTLSIKKFANQDYRLETKIATTDNSSSSYAQTGYNGLTLYTRSTSQNIETMTKYSKDGININDYINDTSVTFSFPQKQGSQTLACISDIPTVPTVNDATLTIQKNGTTIDTFTANASVDKTINITVPTNSDYVDLTSAQTITGVKTFQANSNSAIKVKQHSSSTRVGISLTNTSGSEYGFFQYNGSTGFTVFGASYQGDANNKLAFRYFGSGTNNQYNVVMPGTEKYTALGAGDLNLPLAVQIGSSGTAITASTGGVITLPNTVSSFTNDAGYQTASDISTAIAGKLDATACTYQTTEPTAAATDGGVHIVYLSAEPTTKYAGYIYMIAEN